MDESGTTVFCPLTMNKRAGLFSEIIRSKAVGQYDSGISGSAFHLRQGEPNVSVEWLECLNLPNRADEMRGGGGSL